MNDPDKDEWYAGSHHGGVDARLEALGMRVASIDIRVEKIEATSLANADLLQHIYNVIVAGKVGTAAIKWLGGIGAAVLAILGVFYAATHNWTLPK